MDILKDLLSAIGGVIGILVFALVFKLLLRESITNVREIRKSFKSRNQSIWTWFISSNTWNMIFFTFIIFCSMFLSFFGCIAIGFALKVT